MVPLPGGDRMDGQDCGEEKQERYSTRKEGLGGLSQMDRLRLADLAI